MRRHSRIRAVREVGFTLMELMITLTIAAILLGIAVPSFRSMIASNRLISESTEVSAAMNFARSEAITRNMSVTFCRASLESSLACAGSADEWDFFIVRNALGVVLRRGALPDYGNTVSFESDLTADTLVFSPDGLARTGGALVVNNTFTICASNLSDGNIRTLTVSAGSRFSNEKSSGSC